MAASSVGELEADETYIGGRARNVPEGKGERLGTHQGPSLPGKVAATSEAFSSELSRARACRSSISLFRCLQMSGSSGAPTASGTMANAPTPVVKSVVGRCQICR